jgi:hypothetical protein
MPDVPVVWAELARSAALLELAPPGYRQPPRRAALTVIFVAPRTPATYSFRGARGTVLFFRRRSFPKDRARNAEKMRQSPRVFVN